MAIKSVRDKVEEQSQKIAQTEMLVSDQIASTRRQEKMLSQCESLLEKVEKENAGKNRKSEGEQGTAYRELQTLYDQYLKVHGKKSVGTQKQRDRIAELIDEDGPKKFEQNWLAIGDNTDNQPEG